jgi:hypothetical protein
MEDSTKESTKDSINLGKRKKRDEECSICMEPLNPEDKLHPIKHLKFQQEILKVPEYYIPVDSNGNQLLDENEKPQFEKTGRYSDVRTNRFVCGHNFHKKCIDDSMNHNIEQGKDPECPICKTHILDDQYPDKAANNAAANNNNNNNAAAAANNNNNNNNNNNAAAPQLPIPTQRLNQIRQKQADKNASPSEGVVDIVPFLGVLVCYNRKIIRKYSNIELGVTINQTLGDLKQGIMSRSNEIIQRIPPTWGCTFRNLGNRATGGLISSSTRTIQINNIHFTGSEACSIRNFSNTPMNGVLSQDNETLANIYIAYQQNCNNFLQDNNQDFRQNIWNISKNYQDDGLRAQTDYFVDTDGIQIPEQFRGTPENQYSSLTSFAWLGIDIDCVTSGGKTKKNKKQTKTNKRKSRKSRKSRNMKM